MRMVKYKISSKHWIRSLARRRGPCLVVLLLVCGVAFCRVCLHRYGDRAIPWSQSSSICPDKMRISDGPGQLQTVSWTVNAITVNGVLLKNWTEIHGFASAYKESNIAINAECDHGTIISLSVMTRFDVFLVTQFGIDRVEMPYPEATSDAWHVTVYRTRRLELRRTREHIAISIYGNSKIELSIAMMPGNSKATHPSGFLAALTRKESFTDTIWLLPEPRLFALAAGVCTTPKQLARRTLFQNVVAEIEGPIFDSSGFAYVNRFLWFLLSDLHAEVHVRIRNQSPVLPPVTDVMRRMIHDSLVETSSVPYSATIIFRNQWPPNFRISWRAKVIQLLPWEFSAIPSSWVLKLWISTTQIWVPSHFCRRVMVQNGIQQPVHVFPHHVDIPPNTRTKVSPRSWPNVSRGVFNFLFVGGLQPRKGIDLLLASYLTAFSAGDRVSLTVHATYGDFLLPALENAAQNSSGPRVIVVRDVLTDFEMRNLMSNADAFVLPFRGEGFGIPIVQAMAASIPVITTAGGPAVEVCLHSCTLVPATWVRCDVFPCGVNEMFNMRTSAQPMWYEPSMLALSRALKRTYTEAVSATSILRLQQSVNTVRIPSLAPRFLDLMTGLLYPASFRRSLM